MNLWKWQAGRNKECSYQKFPLWNFRLWKFGFDAYIIKYEPSTILPKHKDPVKGGKHWRLNIKLKGVATFIANECFYINKTFIVFRPDIVEHSLIVYRKGCTKLSLGFVNFE